MLKNNLPQIALINADILIVLICDICGMNYVEKIKTKKSTDLKLQRPRQQEGIRMKRTSIF